MILAFENTLCDSMESSMLKLVSRFVLEVLPYVLSALIAVAILPGFLNSQFHGKGPASVTDISDSAVSTLEMVRQGHAAFAQGQGFSDLPVGSAQHQLIAK
jgi:hypothetical protein